MKKREIVPLRGASVVELVGLGEEVEWRGKKGWR